MVKLNSLESILPSSFDTFVAFFSDMSGAMSGFMKSVRATAAKELRPDEIVLKIQYYK